jgi:antitoxin component YwqK of YwqJK toxin-antitoxin module
MSEYNQVRQEFHDLQKRDELKEVRLNAVSIVSGGKIINPFGLNGVCTYFRKNGKKICEEAFLGGAVDGYARYFNLNEELVGEDYYSQGGVYQTRIFI